MFAFCLVSLSGPISLLCWCEAQCHFLAAADGKTNWHAEYITLITYNFPGQRC